MSKLAFSRPTSTDTESEELFTNFRPIGFDGLQLKFKQYQPYLEEPESFVEKWGHLPGIGSGLIFGGNLDESNMALLRKTFHFAKHIGTDLIVFCHGVPRNSVTTEDIQRYAELLSGLGLEAQQQGIKLSLHHHFNQPVMRRADFDVFFDRIENDTVGLTVDTAHLVKSGIEDISELIHSFGRHIDNFHLKDFADSDWKILGHGKIPFDPIFKAIKDIRYDGWISADEESGGGILEGMKDCFAFMKKGLAG